MVTPGGVERFPGFDVMSESGSWDEVTRELVFRRVRDVPQIEFFTPGEERAARALFDVLLAQDGEPRVPVTEFVDARLAACDGDGYRYEEMPEDGRAWRLTLAALDEEATTRRGRAFAALAREQQRALIQSVRDERGPWYGVPAPRVFDLWIRYACAAFYSHPWSWNEIGFGGPAYPRGYSNLGFDRREHWEVEGIALDPQAGRRGASAQVE